MKTCKKILAMMLTLAMVISMCAFTVTVSADRITHQDAAAEKVITLWDAEHLGVDRVEKGSSLTYIESCKTDSAFKTSLLLPGAATKGTYVEKAVAEVEKQLSETIVNTAKWKSAEADLEVALVSVGLVESTAQTDAEKDLTSVLKTFNQTVNFMFTYVF